VGVTPAACTSSSRCNPETGSLGGHRDEPPGARSSALASKATGFPIAKIATKLAVGYTLDEIRNDIIHPGRPLPASEPALDYVVLKVPRFALREVPRRAPYADHHEE